MMDWLTLWWVWIGIALSLAIIELLAPAFIFLGFALGALAIAGILLIAPGLLAGLSFNALMAVFAVLSLVGWIALKYAFKGQSSGAEIITHDIND